MNIVFLNVFFKYIKVIFFYLLKFIFDVTNQNKKIIIYKKIKLNKKLYQHCTQTNPIYLSITKSSTHVGEKYTIFSLDIVFQYNLIIINFT
jgi:hypothetical protein